MESYNHQTHVMKISEIYWKGSEYLWFNSIQVRWYAIRKLVKFLRQCLLPSRKKNFKTKSNTNVLGKKRLCLGRPLLPRPPLPPTLPKVWKWRQTLSGHLLNYRRPQKIRRFVENDKHSRNWLYPHRNLFFYKIINHIRNSYSLFPSKSTNK